MMIWFLMVSVVLPAVLGNSEGEKWTWPSSQQDQTQADSRKDIYFESSSDKAGRIRVPTSYYDNRRPLQASAVKEQTTNRPRPLSDEFSNEFTSSGENYGNNINGYSGNRLPSANTPNRFGPQQSNDFPQQFGYGQQQYPGQQFPGGAFGGAGPAQFSNAGRFPGQFGGFGGQSPYAGQSPYGGQQFPGQFGAQQFPGQFGGQQFPGQHGGQQFSGHHGGQQFPGQHGGQFPFGQRYPQQYPIGGQGYPTNNIANGILVGPGGPTGIIGRPYGNRYGGGFPGGYGQHAFEGQHNSLGSPYGGGFGGAPFGGGPHNPQFQGGFPGPLFDPNTKNLQVNKIEKSAR